jgi:hypothetical protein
MKTYLLAPVLALAAIAALLFGASATSQPPVDQPTIYRGTVVDIYGWLLQGCATIVDDESNPSVHYIRCPEGGLNCTFTYYDKNGTANVVVEPTGCNGAKIGTILDTSYPNDWPKTLVLK